MTYELREGLPSVDTFLELREAAGLTPYSREAAEQGIPETLYGVSVVELPSEIPVGIGRIVGDGGCVYHICDMAVHPDHQRLGLGTRIMDALWDYIDANAHPRAYVNLMADVDGFYEQWGFQQTTPDSRGMARWTD